GERAQPEEAEDAERDCADQHAEWGREQDPLQPRREGPAGRPLREDRPPPEEGEHGERDHEHDRGADEEPVARDGQVADPADPVREDHSTSSSAIWRLRCSSSTTKRPAIEAVKVRRTWPFAGTFAFRSYPCTCTSS